MTITNIHTIKVALEGEYNFARVTSVEDEQGEVVRLDISFWQRIEIVDGFAFDCGEHETLFAYETPEIRDVCFAGVWNIAELSALLDEFIEEEHVCQTLPVLVEDAAGVPNPEPF